MVERFNRTLKEAVQAGCLEGKSVREATSRFVQMYRATPHSATGISPYEALHGGRKMKVKLPTLTEYDNVLDRTKDNLYKKSMRSRSKGSSHNLVAGAKVLMKTDLGNKLCPRFNPEPLVVVEVKGSSIIATDGKKEIMRDASFFKQIETDSEDSDADPSPEQHGTISTNLDHETITTSSEPLGLAAGRTPRERRAPDRYGTAKQ